MSAEAIKPLLDAYQLSRQLLVSVYALTHDLPAEENNNFRMHMRRAAVAGSLALAQAVRAKKKQRRKAVAVAMNNMIILQAALEMMMDLGMVTDITGQEISQRISAIHQLIDGC